MNCFSRINTICIEVVNKSVYFFFFSLLPHLYLQLQLLDQNLHPNKHSVAYSKWVPYLTDPKFNSTRAFSGVSNLGPQYTPEMFAESMVINVLAAALIGLVVVMPILVLHPKFRNRPQRIVTVTHDRYG